MSHFQRMWAKIFHFLVGTSVSCGAGAIRISFPRLDTVSRHTSFRTNPLGKTRKPNDALYVSEFSTDATINSVIHRHD